MEERSVRPEWGIQTIQTVDFEMLNRDPEREDILIQVTRHIGRSLAIQEERLAESLLGTGLTYAHVIPDQFQWERSDDKILFVVTRNIKIMEKDKDERTHATPDPDAADIEPAEGDDHDVPHAAA